MLIIAFIGGYVHKLVPNVMSFTDYVKRRFGPVVQIFISLLMVRWHSLIVAFSLIVTTVLASYPAARPFDRCTLVALTLAQFHCADAEQCALPF